MFVNNRVLRTCLIHVVLIIYDSAQMYLSIIKSKYRRRIVNNVNGAESVMSFNNGAPKTMEERREESRRKIMEAAMDLFYY